MRWRGSTRGRPRIRGRRRRACRSCGSRGCPARTSCTLPHSGACRRDGAMTIAPTRGSTLALRSASSTFPRLAGAGPANSCRMTSSGDDFVEIRVELQHQRRVAGHGRLARGDRPEKGHAGRGDEHRDQQEPEHESDTTTQSHTHPLGSLRFKCTSSGPVRPMSAEALPHMRGTFSPAVSPPQASSGCTHERGGHMDTVDAPSPRRTHAAHLRRARAGHPVRASPDAQDAGVHGDHACHDRDLPGREPGHLCCRRRGAAASAAVRGERAAREGVQHLPESGRPERRRVADELLRTPRAHPRLLERRHPPRRGGDRGRQRIDRARTGRARLARVLCDARRAARRRTSVHRGRDDVPDRWRRHRDGCVLAACAWRGHSRRSAAGSGWTASRRPSWECCPRTSRSCHRRRASTCRWRRIPTSAVPIGGTGAARPK